MNAQPLQIGHLTKKYFNSLVEGLLLVTNWGNTRAIPVFADIIAVKGKAREAQWKLIKEVKGNGYVCFVFKTKEVFEAYRRENPVPLAEYGIGMAE